MNNQTKKEYISQKLLHRKDRTFSVFKWILCAIITGIVVGTISSLFGLALNYVIGFRTNHKYCLLLLPVGAVLIQFLYSIILKTKDGGTNLVIDAVQSDKQIPLRMTPLIFVSTIITHFVGGSAGREGAALQIGGSIGNFIGTTFKFEDNDRKTLIMCGMSAAFSALFGTPMAAAVFAMEVISIGIMHYAAFVPCVISSLIAHAIASYFGLQSLAFPLTNIPHFTIKNALLISIFAVVCGLLSTFFCMVMHHFEKDIISKISNKYIKAILGGTSVLLLTLLIGNDTYNSIGTSTITACFAGATVPTFAFVLKIVFTTLTLSCGYKGGEIVPTLFIGATFGAVVGSLMHFNTPLLAAIGMGALFCGVTNCPISSLLICFELFGYEAMPYYLLAIPFSYWVSGYHGLYISQKIVYSKYKSNYINKSVK